VTTVILLLQSVFTLLLKTPLAVVFAMKLLFTVLKRFIARSLASLISLTFVQRLLPKQSVLPQRLMPLLPQVLLLIVRVGLMLILLTVLRLITQKVLRLNALLLIVKVN